MSMWVKTNTNMYNTHVFKRYVPEKNKNSDMETQYRNRLHLVRKK